MISLLQVAAKGRRKDIRAGIVLSLP